MNDLRRSGRRASFPARERREIGYPWPLCRLMTVGLKTAQCCSLPLPTVRAVSMVALCKHGRSATWAHDLTGVAVQACFGVLCVKWTATSLVIHSMLAGGCLLGALKRGLHSLTMQIGLTRRRILWIRSGTRLMCWGRRGDVARLPQKNEAACSNAIRSYREKRLIEELREAERSIPLLSKHTKRLNRSDRRASFPARERREIGYLWPLWRLITVGLKTAQCCSLPLPTDRAVSMVALCKHGARALPGRTTCPAVPFKRALACCVVNEPLHR